MARGEDGGGVVFGGIAEVLFGRAYGSVGGGEASLTGTEGGNEPGVRGEGGDGHHAGRGLQRRYGWVLGGFSWRMRHGFDSTKEGGE